MADEVAATPAAGTADTTPAPTGPFNVRTAGEQIAGLLGAERPTEEPSDDREPASDDAPETGSEATTETEEVEDAAETPSEETEGEDTTDDRVELPATLSGLAEHLGIDAAALNDIRVPFKVDGEDGEATLAEIVAGYQRQADYTRKTSELAEQRKHLDSAVEQATAELRSRFETLTSLTAALERDITGQEPDWARLSQENPAQYVAQKEAWTQRQAKLQQARGLMKQAQEQQQAEAQKAHQAYLAEQRKIMARNHPELADPKLGQAKQAELRTGLKDYGFQDDEIDKLADARTLDVAMDALKWRAMQKAQPEKKLLKAKPKVTKPGVQTSQKDRDAERVAAARRNLGRSGKVRDAAALIAQMGIAK